MGRTLSIFLAAALQCMPLVRHFVAAPWTPSAWSVVLRLGAGGMAIFGFDAVSSASNIIPNGYTYQLKVGVATNLTLAYSGGYFPKGWSSSPDPVCPGMSLVNNGSTAKISGTPTAAGTYSAVATCWENANLSGNSENATFVFVVASAGPPPVVNTITISPGATVAPGANVALTPSVSGTGPYAYRWYFNGSPIFRGTNAALTVTNAQTAKAGTYTLVVTSISGSGSGSANLTVTGPPVINAQPEDQYVAPGETVSLSVLAGGTAPLGFQWRFDGTNLPGRTASSLQLTNAGSAGSGIYSVLVSNALGTISSLDAWVRLSTSSISSTTLVFGMTVPWRYNTNGLELGGAWREFDFDDATWRLGPGILGKEDPGNPVIYSALGTTFAGTKIGTRYITNYYFRTHFTLTNAARLTGLNISNVFDDAGIVYLNGVEVSRGTNLPTGTVNANTWALAPAQEGVFNTVNIPPAAAVAGDNALAVEVHQAGTNNSTDVVMGLALFATFGQPQTFPTVVTNPVNVTVDEGSPVSLRIAADGTAPLSYIWLRDDVPVEIGSGPTLQIGRARASDSGHYSCMVTNAFGSATSRAATVTVNSIAPPSLAFVQSGAGSSLSLSFGASVGSHYAIEAATNLTNPIWSVVTNIPALNQTQTVTIAVPIAASGQQFFRVAVTH